MSEAATIPMWGYRPDGAAQIFDLGPGEGLPEGWHASPDVITDPERATAEALTATAARAAETKRVPTAPPNGPDTGGKGAKLSHPSLAPDQVEVLHAENVHLVAEVAELQQALDASRSAYADALAHIEVLATQLAESLASAVPPKSMPESDGSSGAEPLTAGTPPPRSRDEAREAVRALLGEDLTDREIARRIGVSPSTVAAVRKASA